MWGGLCFAFLQVGLVASWVLREVMVAEAAALGRSQQQQQQQQNQQPSSEALLRCGRHRCGRHAAGHSTVTWSAGLDPDLYPTPSSPTTWKPHPTLPMGTANGTRPTTEPEPPTCRGEEDCPPWSTCESQAGLRVCRCGLGYHLSRTLGCVPGLASAVPGPAPEQERWRLMRSLPSCHCRPVRTFPGRLLLHHLEAPLSTASGVVVQIESLFLDTLGRLDGYLGSSIADLKGPSVTVMSDFSARASVTTQQVEEALLAKLSGKECHGSSAACALQHHMGTYQSFSLCHFNVCDAVSTSCSFQDGLVRCSCQPGYLQAHAMDRTCTACGSGFWLQNGACARCPFGFSGTGCQEPLLLALVLVSCLAGLLLLLLLLLAVCLPGRAQPPSLPQLPLHSPTWSLPRVRPPWTLEQEEAAERGESRARSAPWDSDSWQPPANAPQMKTFLGSPSSLTSASRPPGGCHNLVFINDGEEGGKRSYF